MDTRREGRQEETRELKRALTDTKGAGLFGEQELMSLGERVKGIRERVSRNSYL